MRILPSWQPLATCVPSLLKATASTKLGCGKFLTGAGEANFQACTFLSRLLEKRVALSAANTTSVTASPWLKAWIGDRKLGGNGCAKVVSQVNKDLSNREPARAWLLGLKANA